MHNSLTVAKDFRVVADDIYLDGNVNLQLATVDNLSVTTLLTTNDLSVTDDLVVGDLIEAETIHVKGGPLIIERDLSNSGYIQYPSAYDLDGFGPYRMRYGGFWIYYYTMEGAFADPDPAGPFFDVVFERRNEMVTMTIRSEPTPQTHTVVATSHLYSNYLPYADANRGVAPGFAPKGSHRFPITLDVNGVNTDCTIVLKASGDFEIWKTGPGFTLTVFTIGDLVTTRLCYNFAYHAESYNRYPPTYPD